MYEMLSMYKTIKLTFYCSILYGIVTVSKQVAKIRGFYDCACARDIIYRINAAGHCARAQDTLFVHPVSRPAMHCLYNIYII